MKVQDSGSVQSPGGDGCSRRAFLLSVLLGALAAVGCGEQGPSGSDPAVARLPDWLPAAVGDVDAAARIGQAYLKAHADERSRDVLLDAIDAALLRQLGSKPTASAQVLDALRRAVRSEYRRGEALNVGGWVLSRSEARVYAALSLL